MQTLQHELEPTQTAQRGLNAADHPVFRQMMADPAVAYAEEVRSLRQRVALLEAELAATKATSAPAAQLSQRTADQAHNHLGDEPVSEFTASVAPAVVAITPSPKTGGESSPATSAKTPSGESATVSDPGFAQAWGAETTETSFEERVAEKAFFQASTVDEESRSWLLDQ